MRSSATRRLEKNDLQEERVAAENRLQTECAAAEQRLKMERAAAEVRLRSERKRRKVTGVAAAAAVIAIVIGLRWKAESEEFARTKQWADGELARGRGLVAAGDHAGALGVLDGLRNTVGDERRLADVSAGANQLPRGGQW